MSETNDARLARYAVIVHDIPAPSGSDDTMRGHGWHYWSDRTRAQRFWCRCSLGRDHAREPIWEGGGS